VLEMAGLEPEYVGAKGHDIVVRRWGKKVEVKTDTYTALNNRVACEWWSNEAAGKPGWLRYSDADYLVYVYGKQAYVFLMRQLRKRITDIINQYGLERLKRNTRELRARYGSLSAVSRLPEPCAIYAGRREGGALNVLLQVEWLNDLRYVEFEKLFTIF